MYDLKLSQQLKLIKYSLVISCISSLKITNVLGNISAPVIRAVICVCWSSYLYTCPKPVVESKHKPMGKLVGRAKCLLTLGLLPDWCISVLLDHVSHWASGRTADFIETVCWNGIITTPAGFSCYTCGLCYRTKACMSTLLYPFYPKVLFRWYSNLDVKHALVLKQRPQIQQEKPAGTVMIPFQQAVLKKPAGSLPNIT
jgi:hypothetical protein